MSFGYSEEFTAEAARRRAATNGLDEQPVIDGTNVTRRADVVRAAIYIISMLAVVIYGIATGDLYVAILAAAGLAGISLVTLFSSSAWRNAR